MDKLHVGIALGPLAVYVLLLGIINLRRRPLLTTGGRDLLALGIAVSGLLVAGPIELLMPEAILVNLGPYAWAIVLALYFTCLALAVLLVRPRLVIYNMTPDELRPVLSEAAGAIDADAHWAGDSLVLPTLGVHLALEPFPSMRNVSITSVGPRQSLRGWHHLECQLAAALSQCEVRSNPRGVTLVMFGVMTLTIILWHFSRESAHVAQQLQDMLRL